MQIAVLGIDLGKNSCSIVGLDGGGSRRAAATHAPRGSYQARGKAEAVRGGNGGLLRGTSSWPRSSGSGTRGSVDVAGVCSSLCQIAEERRPRRGSDRRGGNATDDAVCRVEERGAARHADIASGSRSIGGGADRADQSAAGNSAGTGHHGCARPAPVGTASGGHGRAGRSQRENALADRRHAGAVVRIGPPH